MYITQARCDFSLWKAPLKSPCEKFQKSQAVASMYLYTLIWYIVHIKYVLVCTQYTQAYTAYVPVYTYMSWTRKSTRRHRNTVALRSCTDFLDSCLCRLPRPDWQVKQWHTVTQTRWEAVFSHPWTRKNRSYLRHLNSSCTSTPWNTGTNELIPVHTLNIRVHAENE